MAVKLTENTLLEGRYSIECLIGAGGMGSVYKAFDRDLNRDCAVKLLALYTDARSCHEDAERFRREGKALSMLVHRNIVSVYRLGLWQERYPFLVMEYLQGESLKNLISRQGPLPWTKALKIMQEVCSGLEYAHAHNIIHRDIKPENILVSTDLETVKIVDFGLCRIQAGNPDEQMRLTATGNLIGTAPYMAPEVLGGEEPSMAVDIYAFACVLHEILTGSGLFATATDLPSMIRQHCYSKPPLLQDKCPGYIWPAGLEELIETCLSKQAKDRPPAGIIQEKLKSILASADGATAILPAAFTAGAVLPTRGKPEFRRLNLIVIFWILLATVSGICFEMKPLAQRKVDDSAWKKPKPANGYALLLDARRLDKHHDQAGTRACMEKILKLPDHQNEVAKLEALLYFVGQTPGEEALAFAGKMKPLINLLVGDEKLEWQLNNAEQYSRVMYRLGRDSDCVVWCKKIVSLSEKISPFNQDRAERLGSCYMQLFDAYEHMNDSEAAESAARKACEWRERFEYRPDEKFEKASEPYEKLIWILLKEKKYAESDREIRREEQLVRAIEQESTQESWVKQLVIYTKQCLQLKEFSRAAIMARKCRAAINKCQEPQKETSGILNGLNAQIAGYLEATGKKLEAKQVRAELEVQKCKESQRP